MWHSSPVPSKPRPGGWIQGLDKLIHPVSGPYHSAESLCVFQLDWDTGTLWAIVSAQMFCRAAFWDTGQKTQLPRVSLSPDPIGIHVAIRCGPKGGPHFITQQLHVWRPLLSLTIFFPLHFLFLFHWREWEEEDASRQIEAGATCQSFALGNHFSWPHRQVGPGGYNQNKLWWDVKTFWNTLWN